MGTPYHEDPIRREELIARYLLRKLDSEAADAFEAHYLACSDCFEEIRATELLICGLGGSVRQDRQNEGIRILRFARTSQLTGTSPELSVLDRIVRTPGDTRVLIDLSGVSRIDSAGLGMLMRCYTHAVQNAGVLKLLNPSSQVKRVLSMTHIDSVVPTFEDEGAALQSFQTLAPRTEAEN